MVDDFTKADREIEKFSSNSSVPSRVDYRQELVKKHHGGAKSIMEKWKRGSDDSIDALLNKLLEELLAETDNLLGNSLLASENGDIRDSTIISAKRADVIANVIRLIQAKQQMAKEGGVDIEGPIMQVVIRSLFKKVSETFERIDMPIEQRNLFFQTIGITMETWKKELKFELEEMRRQNG